MPKPARASPASRRKTATTPPRPTRWSRVAPNPARPPNSPAAWPNAGPPEDSTMTETQIQDTRADDIRGVLIQVTGARLLMPNAAIAEVLSYADPEPVEGTPDWLLGQVRWRGWQL